MLVYNYNSDLHKFKNVHDETGGKLKEFQFQYDDCFCGEAKYRIISNATRHRNHFDIVQCANCGTLRINPYLSDASIEKYYKEVYGPTKRQGVSPEKLFNTQAGNAARLFGQLSPCLTKNSKILDYGSGAGGNMEKFNAEGYEVSLFDYDRAYLEYGLKKGMKEFSEEARYDLIVLAHVVEHISHPLAFLNNLKRRLAPGGMMYIEVPMMENNRSLLADFQLAHKFYFTSESLTYLAGRIGFKKIRDFHNAILIAEGTDEHLTPDTAKKKSDRLIREAWVTTRVSQARVFLKRLFFMKPRMR